VRAEAELDAAVGRHLLEAGEQRVDVRLAEPVGMEPLEVDGDRPPGLGKQARDDLLLQHAAKLARHAGREKEAGGTDIESEAASGADRVVEDLRGRRQHRLLPVVGRHGASASGEERLHLLEPFPVQHQLAAGSLGRDLLREVVDRGTEPAIDDHRVGAACGQPERLQQSLAIVADRRAPDDRQPDILELLAHVAEVRVDDLAGQHLVAGADDLDAHTDFPKAANGVGELRAGPICIIEPESAKSPPWSRRSADRPPI